MFLNLKINNFEEIYSSKLETSVILSPLSKTRPNHLLVKTNQAIISSG